MTMRAPNLRWMSTVAAALAAITLASGCARTMHWRASYGEANRTFFDRQAEAVTGEAPHGLDSEEASIIHRRYREGLGGREAATRADPRSSVMILQEDGDARARGK